MAEQARVPDEGADGQEFINFGHTYNGYELHGGLDASPPWCRPYRLTGTGPESSLGMSTSCELRLTCSPGAMIILVSSLPAME
ncbi:hypothetical protein ACQEUX_16765 [Micromonospora sp. CA-259024]|uniref:hypothetical protein n=1 Tax=Micromonospora sp. CA-259024 TaxID=3239965 RepID=UPI003D8C1AB8